MKLIKIFLPVLFIVFAWQVNAQTTDNTIVNDNSAWATLMCGFGPYNIICSVKTQYVYFEGDSTVATVSYKKVFSCEDELHENIKYVGLIREQDRKTYFIPVNSKTEYLLYDFSLKEGMSFEYTDMWLGPTLMHIKRVDFIEINGVQKKRFQLTKQPPYDYHILTAWIENVGSLSGLFYPSGVTPPGSQGELLCYFEDNKLIYKNPNYSECYYDKVEDITSVQTIVTENYKIFPNPVEDVLTMSSLDNTISLIEIYDVLGKKVYSQTYKESINMSSFEKGLYLLKVYDTNEQVSVFKIIKR